MLPFRKYTESFIYPPSSHFSDSTFPPFSSAPILIFVAVLTLIFGQDHPAGKWSERHNVLATQLAIKQGHQVHYGANERSHSPAPADDDDEDLEKKKKEAVSVQVIDAEPDPVVKSTVDVAVNEALTVKTALKIVGSPLTWLPALAYLTTFGFELALDAKMADILYGIYAKRLDGFTMVTAGYYTSVLYAILSSSVLSANETK